MAIFSTVSALAAIMVLMFPETRGKEIPDTIQQLIEMNEKKPKLEDSSKETEVKTELIHTSV